MSTPAGCLILKQKNGPDGEADNKGSGRCRGFFGRGDMQKAFEDAAFALDVGGISDIVDTDSGLHLIERYISRLPNPFYLQNLLLTKLHNESIA